MIITRYIWIILTLLLLTILVEGLLSLAFRVRGKELIILVLANIATNPIVQSVAYLVLYFEGKRGSRIAMPILEIWAVVTEGFIYSKTFKKRKLNPYLLSFILNAASYLLGLVIERVYKGL